MWFAGNLQVELDIVIIESIWFDKILVVKDESSKYFAWKRKAVNFKCVYLLKVNMISVHIYFI